jgi:hypothetical protein
MAGRLDIDDLILNHDPEFPQERFRSGGLAGAHKLDGALPSPMPSPQGHHLGDRGHRLQLERSVITG